jgi:hypothetical protein
MHIGLKIYQLAIKYINILHCKTPQNLPELNFLARKYTIWQPWHRFESEILFIWIAPDSSLFAWWDQGCQMVCFQTKNPNLGKFWRVLDWVRFIYFTAIWKILSIFEIFHDQLVHFVFIWYIFPFLVSCTKKNLATLDEMDTFNFHH